jgi:hypothetical protein
LPLPAKLVVSAFLISVGVGYFSALVQLHMQHGDRDGNALPTPQNVIERFAGLKEHDGKPPVSKIGSIISGDPAGGFTSTNMAPAFFGKSSGYDREVKDRGQEKVDKEREGERIVFRAWLSLPTAERKAIFDGKEGMPLPHELVGQPLTADYIDAETKRVDFQTLFEGRCLKCHGEGGSNKPELFTYAKIEPLVTPPPLDLIDGKYVRSSKQLGIEALTQSTHAHLLSFSMLFGLTGLTFAFTSLPAVVRSVVGPIVLVAQLADISCWWLARLDGVGPYFAQTIMLTGAVVALGLMTQILLSLFDMYGWRGRLILAAGAFAFLAGLGVLTVKIIAPALVEERAKSTATDTVVTRAGIQVEPPE